MTGSEVLDREHYQLEQHCLWWRRRRHDVALQWDIKKYFLYAILTTGLFHIMVLTNRPNFWARDISWARLFPEASFPQLSISPWCLKRGTTAVLLRPFREDSSANSSALKLTEASNCDVSRNHPPDDETHTHCTERVNGNTFICQDVSSVALCFLCRSVPPPPPSSSSPDHICPSACHADGTFQKRLLGNLSQFSKSINFLCVACLSSSPIFKNRGCSTIMITATGGIRESTHSSLCPSSAQTWRG